MDRVLYLFRQPDRFVVDAVGNLGQRTFYVQAVEDARTVSVLLEKQQIKVLGERICAVLQERSRQFGAELSTDATDEIDDIDPLAVPLEAEFRVGIIGLGWDSNSNSIVVELLAFSEEEVDETVLFDETETGPDALRVFLSPVQAKEFAMRAELVSSAESNRKLDMGPLSNDTGKSSDIIAPVDWSTIAGAKRAQVWRCLSVFVEGLVHRYGLEQQILSCWWQHGAAIEELTSLWQARTVAYAPDSDASMPSWWQDLLERSLLRMESVFAKCHDGHVTVKPTLWMTDRDRQAILALGHGHEGPRLSGWLDDAGTAGNTYPDTREA